MTKISEMQIFPLRGRREALVYNHCGIEIKTKCTEIRRPLGTLEDVEN